MTVTHLYSRERSDFIISLSLKTSEKKNNLCGTFVNSSARPKINLELETQNWHPSHMVENEQFYGTISMEKEIMKAFKAKKNAVMMDAFDQCHAVSINEKICFPRYSQ